jgi:hypothetical protein
MSSPVSALEKIECPACGAQAEWNPTKQKLVCPFCGTESPYQFDRDQGKVSELDLVRTLRELPDDERGWLTARRTVQCQSCRAVMVFDPARVGQNCEFCASPALVPYDEVKAPIRPQGVLPFRIDASQIRDSIRSWWRSKWFAPGKLSRTALVDTLRSLYIPYWTFDAHVHCPWQAEAGYHYYVPVTGHDAKGRPVTRMERRTRWEPAAGVVVAYDTAFLSGHVVEHYQVVLLDAAQRAQEQMHAKLEQLCAAQVPGDTYRNLDIDPRYSGRTFKHVLVPIWLLTYTYGAKVYNVIANGYTGRIAGRYPLSVWKVVLAIAVAIIAALIFFAISRDQY